MEAVGTGAGQTHREHSGGVQPIWEVFLEEVEVEEAGHSEAALGQLDLSAFSGAAGMYSFKLKASWMLGDIVSLSMQCFCPGSHLAVSFQTPGKMMVVSLPCPPSPLILFSSPTLIASATGFGRSARLTPCSHFASPSSPRGALE